MAKPLRQQPPSSSVARLLDRNAALRAIAPPSLSQPSSSPLPMAVLHAPIRQVPPAMSSAQKDCSATGEPANIKREFVLSPSTDETFSQLVDLYRRATRTRLTNSHVFRAVIKAVAHCMDNLEHEARRQLRPQKLPSNARGREGERIRFEEQLARAVVAGIRAAPAYDEGPT